MRNKLLIAVVMFLSFFAFRDAKAVETKDFAEFTNFAKKIEASLNERDASFFDNAIDFGAIVDKATDGYKVSQKLKDSYKSGVERSLKKQSFGQSLVSVMGDEGSFKLLRVNRGGGHPRALFRILDKDGGVNYYSMLLEKKQSVKVVDMYVFANGELTSDTFRRGFLPLAYEEEKGIVGKVMGWEHDFIKNLPKITKMQSLGNNGKYKEALDTYRELPDSLKKGKNILIFRLRYASSVGDDKEYASAMEDFGRHYPDDSALDLVMIDGHTLKGNYAEAVKSIERLDKRVGGDPYLGLLRANTWFLAKKFGPAKESAKKAMKEEPGLARSAHWTLVTVSLEEKDYKETGRLLLAIENNLGIELGDLKDAESYSGFVKSPEYAKWMKSRGK